jgi:hypothetical protein
VDDRHPDPHSEAAARVAQLAAMSISVAEALARLRAQRVADRAATDREAAAAARAGARAAAAAARLTYTPAMDDAWLRTASTSGLLDAWVATQHVPDADSTARAAQERVEQRLRQLHAEAMRAYDTTRANGGPPLASMAQATGLLRGEYGLDKVGTPIQRSLADLHQHLAAADDATPDLISTPTVDERRAAAADAVRHRGFAADHAQDVGAGRLDVAWHAFPRSAEEAMATAPKAAAKAMQALPAPPKRLALTATRSQPKP